MIVKMLTFFILMDFPKHIDTKSMDLSILYFNGSKFLMPSYCVAFYLGLYCVPKYLFTCIQNEKVYAQLFYNAHF